MRAGRQQALVDDPGIGLDASPAQVVLQGLGLRHRRDFGQRHQNDPGVLRVLQAHQRRGQPARGVPFKGLQRLPVVGAGGIHQQQRVPGGRGVQHHKGAAGFIDHPGKRVEHRHLFGTG